MFFLIFTALIIIILLLIFGGCYFLPSSFLWGSLEIITFVLMEKTICNSSEMADGGGTKS